MIIGFERTFRFFFQRYKIKATALFFGGIFIVLIGWPLIGMIVEIYGFFLLFGYVNFDRFQQVKKLSFQWFYSYCDQFSSTFANNWFTSITARYPTGRRSSSLFVWYIRFSRWSIDCVKVDQWCKTDTVLYLLNMRFFSLFFCSVCI